MSLRKEEIDQYQSIDYFVHQKLKSGEKFDDTEVWVKQWVDQYIENNEKKEESYYYAYHSLPKSVEVWEERLKIKGTNTNHKKKKKRVLDFKFRNKARVLLAEKRYKTLVDFENLQPEEYKMIFDWLEKGKKIPEYLGGIIEYQPTMQERVRKQFENKLLPLLMKSENVIFYVFLGFFFMMLMLLNL